MIQKNPRYVAVTTQARFYQRCIAVPVSGARLSASLQEQLDDIRVPPIRGAQ
jgi:hypothetical protein